MKAQALGLVVAALVGCSPAGGPSSTIPAATAAPASPVATTAPSTMILATAAASPAPTGSPEARAAASPSPEQSAVRDFGPTRIRFTVDDVEIIVRTADNPTSRDFVSMLPLTLNFRDFNAMEKVGDLPRRLTTQGSTGSAPANGDLIYFIPWGNLGFFYNAERRDAAFDDRVIPIGVVENGYERLSELETGPVRIELIP